MIPAGCHVARPNILLVTSRPRQLTLGVPVLQGETCPSSPLTGSRQPSQQPAAAFLTAPQMQIHSSVICRWGVHSWTQSLLQPHWIPDSSNLADTLPAAVSGQAFHRLTLIKPFSGQSCQQAGRAAWGGCREARPWCNVLQAVCWCAAGIKRARHHGNQAGMAAHQPWWAGAPGTSPGNRMPGGLAQFLLPSLHLT